MKVIKEGYIYELENVENPQLKGQTIQFIEKGPLVEGEKALKTIANGTSVKELADVLVEKLKFQSKVTPSRELSAAITNIQQGLHWLEDIKK